MLAEDEGVILRVTDYGEKHRIVTLFLREQGRASALARGARSSTRRFGGGLDLFVRTQVQFARSGANALPVLAELNVIDTYEGLHADVTRYAVASFFAELVLETTAERDPSPAGYAWLTRCLASLASWTPESTDLLLAFQLGWFHTLGILPPLTDEAFASASLPALSDDERSAANELVETLALSDGRPGRHAIGRLTRTLRERVLNKPLRSETFLRELLSAARPASTAG